MRYLEENHNRNFTQMIRSRKHLVEYVEANHNSLPDAPFKEKIYTTMKMLTNICPFGKRTKVTRFNIPPISCGHKCKCAQLSRSYEVSKRKQDMTCVEVAEANAKPHASHWLLQLPHMSYLAYALILRKILKAEHICICDRN